MIVYYVAAKRGDGAIPTPEKALHDKVFFTAYDAKARAAGASDFYGVNYCAIEANMEPIRIVEEE